MTDFRKYYDRHWISVPQPMSEGTTTVDVIDSDFYRVGDVLRISGMGRSVRVVEVDIVNNTLTIEEL